MFRNFRAKHLKHFLTSFLSFFVPNWRLIKCWHVLFENPYKTKNVSIFCYLVCVCGWIMKLFWRFLSLASFFFLINFGWEKIRVWNRTAIRIAAQYVWFSPVTSSGHCKRWRQENCILTVEIIKRPTHFESTNNNFFSINAVKWFPFR